MQPAIYDAAIAAAFGEGICKPDTDRSALAGAAFRIQSCRCQMTLRYGENPHQAAGLYGDFDKFFQQIHGKELSYNNILDLTAAGASDG